MFQLFIFSVRMAVVAASSAWLDSSHKIEQSNKKKS